MKIHDYSTWIAASLTLLFCIVVILFIENDAGNSESPGENHDMTWKTTTGLKLPRVTSDKQVRPPVAAGSFYPSNPETLYDEISKMLGSSPPLAISGVRAILVPHAGYVFSGPIAADAFREVGNDFKTVVILAANHNSQADFSGVSLPLFTHYAIPGTDIPISPLTGKLIKNPLFTSIPQAHAKQMIEIELPFIQRIKGNPTNPDYTIIPMILGRMDIPAIESLAKALQVLAGPETLFIFSVDLSHYYPESQAKSLDSYAIESILATDTAALSRAATDGNHVLMTLVELARLLGWESTLLRYSHSGETSGDRDRVVGYAAIAFHDPLSLNEEEKKALLSLARKTIATHLEYAGKPPADKNLLDRFPRLKTPRAAFVTLKKNGVLRGCIGNLTSNTPLYREVQNCAMNAATHDNRFPPVARAELGTLSLSISVLGQPTRVKVSSPSEYPQAIRPGKDGIILVHKRRTSTFLPTVWKDIPNPVAFLSQLCLKQGSPPGCWNAEGTVLYRYEAFDFEERD